MTTVDFITALFSEVDDQLRAIPKHPEARLWPSEVVTLGLLHALKGVGNRAFYRWLTRDYQALFPHVPERTRLFRLFRTHQGWTQVFLASPTVLAGHRHVWDRIDPSYPRRPEPRADRPQRPLQSSLDCRGQTLSAAQPVGVGGGLGVCHRQCRG